MSRRGPIDRVHTTHLSHPTGVQIRVQAWTMRCTSVAPDCGRCERESGHDGECRGTAESGREYRWRDSWAPWLTP
jgi:hypothetical protein